jgi:hypothetical protein
LIERGHDDWLAARVKPASVSLEKIKILSPVTTPCRIYCQGANYRRHMIESGMDPDAKLFNMFFTKSDASVASAHGRVTRPSHVALLDYEIELALVFRRPPLFRHNGKLAIGMKANGNILAFGDDLKRRMAQIIGELPIGVGAHLVSDPPVVVEHPVSGFTEALFEAVVIVLAVSFVSLGVRGGLVVACAIPLVLAITFVFMAYAGINLQRISLGAFRPVGSLVQHLRQWRLSVDTQCHNDRTERIKYASAHAVLAVSYYEP